MKNSRVAQWALPQDLLRGAEIVAALKVAQLLGESFRTDDLLLFEGWESYVGYKGDDLLRSLLTLPVFALTLHAVEHVDLTGGRRIAAVVAMALVCSLVSASMMTWSLPYPPVAIRIGSSASIEAWFWYTMWANLVIVVLAILTLDHLRERRLAVERLGAVQDRGRAVRQELAQAQLMAIQARVDPQLLFDMLKAVKRFYQQDAGRAEHLLDELAAFLRAALPRLRSPHSSLEVEFQLVASYTRLLQIASDTPVRFTMDLPSSMSGERFPAGLLLPLATCLIDKQTGDRRIGLRASAGGVGPCVSIVAGAAVGADEANRLVAALDNLYGGRARCRALPDCGPAYRETAVLELEVPREQP
jgi:hypothetical protein